MGPQYALVATTFWLVVALTGCEDKAPPPPDRDLGWSGYIKYDTKLRPDKDNGVSRTDANGITYTSTLTFSGKGRLDLLEMPIQTPDGKYHYAQPIATTLGKFPVKVLLQVTAAEASYDSTLFRRSGRTEARARCTFRAVADNTDVEAGEATEKDIEAIQRQPLSLTIEPDGRYQLRALGPGQKGKKTHTDTATHTFTGPECPTKYKKPPDNPPMPSNTNRGGEILFVAGKLDSGYPNRVSGTKPIEVEDDPPRTVTVTWRFDHH